MQEHTQWKKVMHRPCYDSSTRRCTVLCYRLNKGNRNEALKACFHCSIESIRNVQSFGVHH